MNAAPASEEAMENSIRKPGRRSRWWLEIIYILVLYGIYTGIRNFQGTLLKAETAMRHGYDVVDAQRFLHMIDESTIQNFFLPHEWIIRALNVYYGSAHFVVTIGVLAWLFYKQVDRYIHWRNVIFFTSALALIGYVTYPLAPPRMLAGDYGLVDTMLTVGGLWSFENGAVQSLSNQYAAMPSLHVAWSLWCALAVMPVLAHTWSRVLIALYPALTILTIVVTGNHYWLDVFGGALVFSVGYVLATRVERWRERRKVPQGSPAGLTSAV